MKCSVEFQDQDIEPKINNMIQDTNSNDFFGQIPQDTSLDDTPKLHKVRPSNPDYQKLSKYFAYRPIDIIRKTWNQTTQLVKSVLDFPMRRHFKSRFQMLRKPRLNEKVTTDTYFASSRSLEGYTCAQVFFGCTYKTINVYGMKTESEFSEVYKDFMNDRGIPHTLKRDNARS